MIQRLLVANRGEIARRVFATCRRLGIETVAVHSDADAGLPFVAEADRAVRLPGNAPADTYLRADLVIEAARRSGADAIHPGYGFLSENAAFARAVIDAGLTWVGPPPEAIEAMGDKVRAKEIAEKAGVPVLTAPDEPTEADLPLLVKASAGGGGRGMRVVRTLDRLEAEIEAARAEAASAFGDGTVFVEPYVEAGRHVEVQVMADASGARALGTRDCSVQRRHQKVVEEAPAPGLPAATEEAMCAAAESLAERHRLPRRGHGRVPLRPGSRPLLLPRDEHPAPGRAPGHRAGDRRRPRRGAGRGRGGPSSRRSRGGHAAGTRSRSGSTPRTRRTSPRAGGWSPSTCPPTPVLGLLGVLRHPRGQRLRVGRRGVDVLRRHAGQGDGVGADPRAGDPDARRGPPPGPHPRRDDQPRPARRDPHRPGVRGRRDDDDVAGVASDFR